MIIGVEKNIIEIVHLHSVAKSVLFLLYTNNFQHESQIQ